MIGFIFHVYYYNTFNQMCLIIFYGEVMPFTVGTDGDRGTLPLPKFKPKDSWTTNNNKVQSGW